MAGKQNAHRISGPQSQRKAPPAETHVWFGSTYPSAVAFAACVTVVIKCSNVDTLEVLAHLGRKTQDNAASRHAQRCNIVSSASTGTLAGVEFRTRVEAGAAGPSMAILHPQLVGFWAQLNAPKGLTGGGLLAYKFLPPH